MLDVRGCVIDKVVGCGGQFCSDSLTREVCVWRDSYPIVKPDAPIAEFMADKNCVWEGGKGMVRYPNCVGYMYRFQTFDLLH